MSWVQSKYPADTAGAAHLDLRRIPRLHSRIVDVFQPDVVINHRGSVVNIRDRMFRGWRDRQGQDWTGGEDATGHSIRNAESQKIGFHLSDGNPSATPSPV